MADGGRTGRPVEFFLLHFFSSYAQKRQVHDFVSLMLYDPANHVMCVN